MTSKEDVKKALDGLAQFIIMNDNGTDESASAIEWHDILKQALERAKKVEELLMIYKQYYNGYLSPADQKRRQDLEKDLEEK